MDSTCNLFGTTSGGGNSNCINGCGVAFKLAPNGSGGYTESTLYSFAGGNDGAIPQGGLILDSAGDLYGTTTAGESSNNGTVFKLAPNGSGGYTESLLYSFNGSTTLDGAGPEGSLLLDSAGNLWGTTQGGGFGDGTVFKLAPNGSGGYAESVVHAFSAGSDGANPQAGLIIDSTGKLYGTTSGGGNQDCNSGCGIAFEITQ